MNTRLFSEAMSEVNDKYYEEAMHYKKRAKKRIWVKAGVIAACLVAAIAVGILFEPFSLHDGMVVSAYVSDTDEKITEAGAVMSSGTISDSGEMRGHPLMFYLSGKGIASVRFSCRNQQISFMDWTEKRDEYGNAQNFTVAYGEDENEYYYLTIDWVPNAIIRELTDNADSTIANLPEEVRHDIIVMEIAFENGETATKAITISLLDDGTFFAAFDDYKISDADTFVRRPDSEGIPRDRIFPAGGDKMVTVSGTADAAPMVYVNDTLYKQSVEQISYEERNDDFVYCGKIATDITDTQYNSGGGTDGVPKENFQANHPIVGAEIYRYGDNIVVKIEGKYWLYEAVDDDISENSEKQNGLSDEEAPTQNHAAGGSAEEASETAEETLETAKAAAEAYYADTVFEVVSMAPKTQSEDEISFSVCVSKGGIVQEPDRTIWLRSVNGVWEVVNEGY